MGLAASQARLLLLTARKSDLEFRAQQITNATMMLAMQSEQVASEYAVKLSNQTIKYITGGGSNMVEITAASLTNLTSGQMRLQLIGGQNINGEPVWNDWSPNGTLDRYEDEEGNSITPEEYSVLSDADKTAYTPMYTGTSNNYSGAEILAGLNAGTMRIVTASGEDVNAQNSLSFSVCYDTSDDAQAEAEYRRKTSSIQVKEKQLQMDLKQVETQQKACEQEIDSVKKVMDKNIERSFKTFS